ncbi:MAG: hypothetical protein LUC34_01775, partial [Campylobacter sp.]|nr:hypothetical protein [Campylobacter sp.]
RDRESGMDYEPDYSDYNLAKKTFKDLAKSKLKTTIKFMQLGGDKFVVEEYYKNGKIIRLIRRKFFKDAKDENLVKNDVRNFYLTYGLEDIRLYSVNDQSFYEENGSLESRHFITVELGDKRYISIYYHPNGKPRELTFVKDGTPILGKYYDENGVLTSEFENLP